MRREFVGNKIIFLKVVDSTNAYCRELIKSDQVSEGTVVVAGKQTMGRGVAGNQWESDEGKNLTFSVILRPSFLEAAKQFHLSMAVSLGIADYLSEQVPDISVKWPNDIYAGNKKIAGILIENSVMENRLEVSVAGVGININQLSFSNRIPNPVSLSQLTGRIYSIDTCLESLCSNIDYWYDKLRSGESAAIRENYIRSLFRLNQHSEFSASGVVFTAIIKGVDKFGRLELETETGNRKYYGFKEVEFIF